MAAAGMLNEVATQSFTACIYRYIRTNLTRTFAQWCGNSSNSFEHGAGVCDCDPFERKYGYVSIDGSKGTKKRLNLSGTGMICLALGNLEALLLLRIERKKG
jgi:hypothetical protein